MNEEFNSKNPTPGDGKSEDWGMTNPLSPSSEEISKSGWKMPEPVFRKSDGYCPLKSGQPASVLTSSKKPPEPIDEKLSNLYAPPAPEADLPDLTMHNINLSDLKASLENESIAPKREIEPPPISEQLSVPEVEPPIAAQKKTRSRTKRLIFATLGVLAMIIFATAFLGLVYYLYLRDYWK